MEFFDGSSSAIIISDLIKNKILKTLPFYILTAYEDENTKTKLKNKFILDIFTKPLTMTNTEKMLINILEE